MKIPVHRIQNVLDAFAKHVARSAHQKEADPKTCAGSGFEALHPPAALRQTIIEHVEQDIIQRVYDLPRNISEESALHSIAPGKHSADEQPKGSQTLKYCRIDSKGNKEFFEIDLVQFH
uniref:Uncharacterized protein n=1 Tax=Desulfatirhabdium butyrativorans TaxID=340467 RepID=A0A7C4RH58_9BACT